jgi:hypothetical protein
MSEIAPMAPDFKVLAPPAPILTEAPAASPPLKGI